MMRTLNLRGKIVLLIATSAVLIFGIFYLVRWLNGSHTIVGPDGSNIFLVSGQGVAENVAENSYTLRGSGEYWVRVESAGGLTDVFVVVVGRRHQSTNITVDTPKEIRSFAAVSGRDVYVEPPVDGFYYFHPDSMSLYHQQGHFLPQRLIEQNMRIRDVEWLAGGSAFVQSAAGNIYYYDGGSLKRIYQNPDKLKESLSGPVQGPFTDDVSGERYVFVHKNKLFSTTLSTSPVVVASGVRQDSVVAISPVGVVFYGENSQFISEQVVDFAGGDASHDDHTSRPARYIVNLNQKKTELSERLAHVRDIYDAAFTDDGSTLALATSSGLLLYDLANDNLSEHWIGGDRLIGNLMWVGENIYFTDKEALWRFSQEDLPSTRLVANPSGSIVIESGLFRSKNGQFFISTTDPAQFGVGEIVVVE